ncbi:hypothetical protein CN527_02350 [Bacillus cereus]|nr:hypothetical protein CN527_02350 [Bacillus cereus]
MRYTRNRQLYNLTKDKHWYDTYNVTIGFNRKWAPLGLDSTFKWHRDFHGMNIVSFNRKGESFKTYVIKGRN